MFRFNEEQEYAIQRAVNHIKFDNEQVLQISGDPGTGKTTVMHEIIRRIGIPLERVAPMAFVGQAAINMRIKGLYNAKTIHSWLYDCVEVPVYDELGRPVMDPVYNKPMKRIDFIPRDLRDIDYFIIDEGSTVPLHMKKDIESRGKKIIVMGDINQLPPVGDDPAYLTSGEIIRLTQIMRQAKGSEIITLSKYVLSGYIPTPGLYGNVLVIEKNDLTDQMMADAQMILCGKNKTRDAINDYYRKNILHLHTNLPMFGEKVICRKNNWSIEYDGISLANGLVGTVVRPPDVTRFDGKLFDIDFQPNYMNIVFPDLRCDYKYFVAPRGEKEFIKNSKYSRGEKFEFAYANTTHLTQGAQYSNGIYISEYLHKDIQNNLNYVGVTRFKNAMIYVVPSYKSKYF